MSLLTNAARSAARNAVNALVDAGAGANPTLRFRTSADADLLIVTLDATNAILDAVDGVSSYEDPVSGGGSWATFSQNPTADGLADYVAVFDTDGTEVERYSIGVTGSGEEVIVNTLNFVTTLPVTATVAPTCSIRAYYDPTP